MAHDFDGKLISLEEVEKIRLLLSTYQDGTGQLVLKKRTGTLPNWRDFERSVATAIGGSAQENKAIFDVIVKKTGGVGYGVSCKMRQTLNESIKKSTIYVELSNAARDFWRVINKEGINDIAAVKLVPERAGNAIIELVNKWIKDALTLDNLTKSKSYFLICQYETKKLQYQLFMLPLILPNATDLTWSVRNTTLVAKRGEEIVIEWYSSSGGQLKYYPKYEDAIWMSAIFTLEPLPEIESGYGIIQKAKAYFPKKWKF